MIYVRQGIYQATRLSFILLFLSIITACESEEILPLYKPGVQIPITLGSSNSPYGYHIFTPDSYTNEGSGYPLLIFLHGSGERGNSSVLSNRLNLVLKHGPPKLIDNNKWYVQNPMIVASPQAHDGGGWHSIEIHEFIEYLVENYQVDENRIYLTGLEMGGNGIFTYLGDYGDQSYAAACVPICGAGNNIQDPNLINTPIWVFHGANDDIMPVSHSIQLIDRINRLNPPVKAKLTVYRGVGHDSWSQTYDESGMCTENTNSDPHSINILDGTRICSESIDYDPFSVSIYDWMFEHQK